MKSATYPHPVGHFLKESDSRSSHFIINLVLCERALELKRKGVHFVDCRGLFLGDGGQRKWEAKDKFLAHYLLRKGFRVKKNLDGEMIGLAV